MLVASGANGILAICSAVMMVVDSTEETSIGLIAPEPTTVTVSRVAVSPLDDTKSMFADVPTLTVAVRALAPLRVTVY